MMNDRLKIYDEINRVLDSMDTGFCIKPSGFFVAEYPQNFGVFEQATRTCYGSHNKICPGSDTNLFEKIMRRGHTAMVEFLPSITVQVTTDRGVSHEMVRMRKCSFAQASTRYITYDSKVPFVMPWTMSPEGMLEFLTYETGKNSSDYFLFFESCLTAATLYKKRLNNGQSAQEARGSLNAETATSIWVKANIREWLHIFKLRSDAAAHPNYRIQACGLLKVMMNKSPFIFTENRIIEQGFFQNLEWFDKWNDLVQDGHGFSIIPKVVA